jgi:hypothetical protein
MLLDKIDLFVPSQSFGKNVIPVVLAGSSGCVVHPVRRMLHQQIESFLSIWNYNADK